MHFGVEEASRRESSSGVGMTNAELADRLEMLGDDGSEGMPFSQEELDQIIAALRQPSSDQVLVPRVFLEAAICPECDGSGFNVRQPAAGQFEQVQCQ